MRDHAMPPPLSSCPLCGQMPFYGCVSGPTFQGEERDDARDLWEVSCTNVAAHELTIHSFGPTGALSEWRRLAAPGALPKEIVAVLRAVEYLMRPAPLSAEENRKALTSLGMAWFGFIDAG